mgnify:CR=1 FL=1
MNASPQQMQQKTHIKKGDMVKVLAGEDRAKQGRVLDVDRSHGTALVEGLRINKKHSKPTTATPQGGIVEKEGPCLLYTSPSPRDRTRSRMPSSA